MITQDEAIKIFDSQPTIEAMQTGLKRIVIPVFGFSGAQSCSYTNWRGEKRTEDGLIFYNHKDNATQVLKQSNGCLICYDGVGRQGKISSYLAAHPNAVKSAEGIQQFVKYLADNVVNDSGKADLWVTDTAFASKLKDAPGLDEIKPGQMIVSVKKQEAVNAIYVRPGVEFEGPSATSQTAGPDGAYIVKYLAADETFHYHMVQKAEFDKAYTITKQPPIPSLSRTGGR